jgi:hypothetical protein
VRGIWIGAVALLALGAAAGPAMAETGDAAEPRLGISVNRIFNDTWFDQDFVDEHLAEVRAAGIRLARTDAFWMTVEEEPPDEDGVHTYDWAFTDFAASNLTEYGVQWLPILDYSALWAGTQGEHSPPKDLDDYAAYAQAFAERYGRGGDFWELHPELPEMPVTTYEIWNEPNGAWFWNPQPDPERYADMYTRARAAIKEVDPDAIVMIGGLVPWNDFVRPLFRALGESRTEADAIGFHPYAPTPADVFHEVRSFRATLDDLGQRSLPIYITEIGWPTNGSFANVRPDAERAAYLTEVADGLVRSDCNVRQVIPYTWATPEEDPADAEDWYGIHHWDGSRTATSSAYAQLVRAHEAGTASTEVVPVCTEPSPPENARADVPEQPPPERQELAPDLLAPDVAVHVHRRSRTALRRRGARATVSCSEACDVLAVLTLGRRRAGQTSRSLRAGKRRPLVIELAPWARRALARSSRPRLRLTVVATDAAGNSRRVSRRLLGLRPDQQAELARLGDEHPVGRP